MVVVRGQEASVSMYVCVYGCTYRCYRYRYRYRYYRHPDSQIKWTKKKKIEIRHRLRVTLYLHWTQCNPRPGFGCATT